MGQPENGLALRCHSRSDAERPERHAHAEHGHDGVSRSPSFRTLRRGNTFRDALRHRPGLRYWPITPAQQPVSTQAVDAGPLLR
ncbi:DUF1534 domain-containing protein [Pseudomonas cannabina]|nr:DUF1534 domain-containing protein [Pseudomonas cannabina]